MAGQSTQSRWDPLVLAGFFDDYERTLLNAVVRRCRIWWYVTSSPVSLGGRLDRPGPHRITTMLEMRRVPLLVVGHATPAAIECLRHIALEPEPAGSRHTFTFCR